MDIVETFKQIDEVWLKGFIDDNQEENLHLEFKTVNNPAMEKEDRKNFSEALSGFANSDGGIIVWGIEARANDEGIDCACRKKCIKPLSQFVSSLNKYTGDVVNPDVEGIQHKKIVSSNDEGYVVTLVPPSDAGPHMARATLHRYYKRSGDRFLMMEHFDIEDMFGRRKKPKLILQKKIVKNKTNPLNFNIIIGLENIGRGSAKSPFLDIEINSPYAVSENGFDGNGNFGLTRYMKALGSNREKYGSSTDIIIHPGLFHEVTAIKLDLDRARKIIPQPPDLIINYKIVAEDMRMIEDTETISYETLVG